MLEKLFKGFNKNKSKKKVFYVLEVAQKYHKSYKAVLKEMEKAKEKYGISFSKYALNDYYAEESIKEVQERERARDERVAKKICNATGKSHEEVKKTLTSVKNKYGITPRQYFERQLYVCSDAEIAKRHLKDLKEREERFNRIMGETGWTKKKSGDIWLM